MKCSVSECDLDARSKGFCDKHYYRFKAHGDPLVLVNGVRTSCIVDGCETKPFGLGYCQMHYRRFKRHGDTGTAGLTRRKNGTGCFRKDGYHLIYNGRQSKLAHRVLVEEVIGIQLPHDVVIHHVDGNPSNNENINLVVCPDHAYHMLVHSRARALDLCGNANWRKCDFCGQYDDPSRLVFYGKHKQPRHRECNTTHHRDYIRKRKYNPSTDEETLL